ncbi:MAG: hypothetical protein JWM11_1092 [Planctomycetaceae bacterium]|nr:hypothetical protein [Planctomycetaceae bacterium]
MADPGPSILNLVRFRLAYAWRLCIRRPVTRGGRFHSATENDMSQTARNQQDLNCAVANATGEDGHVIRHRGLSYVNLREENFDLDSDHRPPFVIDWGKEKLSRGFDRTISSIHSLAEVA